MSTETTQTSARAVVLGRIRAAIGTNAASDPSRMAAQCNALPRAYRRRAEFDREAMLELLEDRLRDYDAHVVRVPAAEVMGTLEHMLAERGKRRLVVPAGLAEALGAALPRTIDFVEDSSFTSAELNGFEGVVTSSSVAIAQTGTIVLQNVPGQGRRAPTLIPDYHLCVVRADDVVETVPEALARLAATASVATTFISGPSATADIEMTRIKGVHGPRFLDVILAL